MAGNVSDFKAWRPKTAYYEHEFFQHLGKVYKVLEPFVSDDLFRERDSRYTLSTIGQASEGDARGIADVDINNAGDLIITYTDGTTTNVGNVRPPAAEDRWTVDILTVNGSGIISNTSENIDTSMVSKLTVNNLTYYSVETPTRFTISGKTITWVSSEFSLSAADKVVAEYYKV